MILLSLNTSPVRLLCAKIYGSGLSVWHGDKPDFSAAILTIFKITAVIFGFLGGFFARFRAFLGVLVGTLCGVFRVFKVVCAALYQLPKVIKARANFLHLCKILIKQSALIGRVSRPVLIPKLRTAKDFFTVYKVFMRAHNRKPEVVINEFIIGEKKPRVDYCQCGVYSRFS